MKRRDVLAAAAAGVAAGLWPAVAAGAKPRPRMHTRTITDQVGLVSRAYTAVVGSGLWRSGVHTGSFPPDYADFAAWRGRELAGTLQYSDRSSWAGLEDPWPLNYTWPGELIIAQPFWPEGSGGSLAATASGSYDTHWAAYGTTLTNAGKGTLLTEFAWEMNGNWWEWSVTTAAAYINAWRKVVDAVRTTAPNARFLWTINAHTNGPTGNPMDAYPGDSYVDVIGIDAYDMFPKSTDLSTWNAQATATAGIEWTLDQAQAHGKQLAVPEWGIWIPADADHGGDNPYYVQRMQDFFRANKADLYMECYFDASTSVIFDGTGLTDAPNSGTEYKAGLHS